jgi:DNA-binding transcriptional ArsR family regulator
VSWFAILRHMPKRLEGIDEVFHALSDPTRRKVVERLVSGPATTSELAQPFDMSLPSFTQHLGVLERAGLVTSSKKGRVRTYHLAPTALELADGWLAEQRRLWERRLNQLDAFVLTLEEER